jgi:hypothetical protein
VVVTSIQIPIPEFLYDCESANGVVIYHEEVETSHAGVEVEISNRRADGGVEVTAIQTADAALVEAKENVRVVAAALFHPVVSVD